jgi:hypothetical protein
MNILKEFYADILWLLFAFFGALGSAGDTSGVNGRYSLLIYIWMLGLIFVSALFGIHLKEYREKKK